VGYKHTHPWSFEPNTLKVRIGRMKARVRELSKDRTKLNGPYKRALRLDDEIESLLKYIEECEKAYQQMREDDVE
jgi:hypothetical protein